MYARRFIMVQHNLWLGLVNNSSWLLCLFIVYDLSFYLKIKNKQISQLIHGILIGLICIAVMALPYPLTNGIVFDTRSILISITALMFGFVPASIAAGVAVIFRVLMGGAGALAGVATIVSSAIVGLVWRKWFYPTKQGARWVSVYFMSFTVHIVMILNMLLLPEPNGLAVIRIILFPVMLIFPVVSFLLSILLIHQQERRQLQDTIKKNEEEYRRITENISDIVWLTDLNLNTTFVSQSVERILGETPIHYMKRSIEDKFPPEAVKKIKSILEEELQLDKDPTSNPKRTRVVELEHYKIDGSLVWLSIHMSFLRDTNGNPIGFQGISRDISKRKASEFALEAERNKSQLYIDNSPVIFIVLDTDMKVSLINKEGCKRLGYSKEMIIGKDWIESFVPEKDRRNLTETLETKFAESCEDTIDLETSLMTEQTNERIIFWRIAGIKDATGMVKQVLLSGIDITDQTIAISNLRESERSKRVLLENLPGMTYRCNHDRNWSMLYASNGCLELTGYEPEALVNNKVMSFNNLIVPHYQEHLWKKWEEVLKTHTKLKEEYEIITASGDWKWVWEQGQGIFDEDGNVVALEGIILDITERKNYENNLKFIANHNSLTGLLNLRSFQETFSRLNTNETTSNRAIIIVNIRKFSYLNRIYGYPFGDQLIQDISNYLKRITSDFALLFHISIDRFLFYIPDYQNKQELIDLYEQMVESLDTSITLKTVCFSIGILEIDSDEVADSESILKRAEIASDYKQEHSRFSSSFFTKEMEEKQLREIAISNLLSETMNNENDTSLVMLYQPIVNPKTNQIKGFEALARYYTKELGVVSPLEFIPIAESSQMIIHLGYRIMRLVFDFALCLMHEGFHGTTISFNVSAIQILSETFLPDLEELITETGVDPRNLIIELTESVFSDNYFEINEKIERLKQLGIKIAIDDFGTGYSSLARERELNVDTLKIDRYFINDLTRGAQENAITGDIISMAHKMGHSVIAEGVELEEQRQYLLEHDCDLIQGYLYGKPVEGHIAIDLLIKNNQECLSLI